MDKRPYTDKCLLIAALVLASLPVSADIVEPYYPALFHRIVCEVFVYVAGAIAGNALVRYLAKRNWRIGKEWKTESDLKESDAAKIDERIRDFG